MIELNGNSTRPRFSRMSLISPAISQVIELLNQEFVAGSRIRIMPDIHAEPASTIGTTMTITDKIVRTWSAWTSDAGWKPCASGKTTWRMQRLDKAIRELIPAGFEIRKSAHRYADRVDLDSLRCAKHVDLDRARRSVGSLGGGNHFIEVDQDDQGQLYIVVHSGSRHLGLEVAKYYQEAGYKALNKTDEASIQKFIDEMKAAGRQREIQKELKHLKAATNTSVRRRWPYVEGSLFDDYIYDMKTRPEICRAQPAGHDGRDS